jgi:predicted MFS family arabinose efflux permease
MAGPRWQPASRALMAGNFAIGCGVMVVAGALNDLAQSLAVSPAVAGQLITAGAVGLALGAPLLAAVFAGWDRRVLLTAALAWFATGHVLSALMPDYTALLPLRAASVLGAAVFTPQAAAAINVLAPPEQRGRAITLVFLGWSISSVLGMPLHSFIGESFGWRWAFATVALMAAAAALGVWRTLPAGIRPPALSLAQWKGALTHPALMAMVAVTALSAAGQFTLFSYLSPYYRQALGASAAEVSFLFFWFGAFGLVGNVLISRHIDRLGAARGVNIALVAMALTLGLWPLTGGHGVALMAIVLVPWALGCFSSNSAQQARLSQAGGVAAPALLALNTSAIYVGQAAGAGGGGALLAAQGFGPLPWAALAWMAAALGFSVWAARRVQVAHA